jgi:hypothetical protein
MDELVSLAHKLNDNHRPDMKMFNELGDILLEKHPQGRFCLFWAVAFTLKYLMGGWIGQKFVSGIPKVGRYHYCPNINNTKGPLWQVFFACLFVCTIVLQWSCGALLQLDDTSISRLQHCSHKNASKNCPWKRPFNHRLKIVLLTSGVLPARCCRWNPKRGRCWTGQGLWRWTSSPKRPRGTSQSQILRNLQEGQIEWWQAERKQRRTWRKQRRTWKEEASRGKA